MKLASIEIIRSIKKHPNADTLDLVQVLGWQVVAKSGIHQQGDKIVFIPIDTVLPKENWSSSFVDKNNPDKPIRLKMIKLRGEHSAGVVLPLSLFPSFTDLEEGTDVGEQLNITKYIKELPANLSGENVGEFPTHLASKTDEDNGLSNLSIVEAVIKSGLVTISQKIDGSSHTTVFENGEVTQVCSRNLSKKETDNSLFWKAARKLKVPQGFTGVLQSELAGNGIQKNEMRLEGIELFAFQLKKASGDYMNYQEMQGFCMVELGCPVVPLIEDNVDLSSLSIEEALQKLQEIADKQVYATSNRPAEGIVVRPKDYRRSFESRRPLSFKILNRNYKEN